MYKVNFYLKLFIALLLMIVTAMTYNYYVLWMMLCFVSLINYYYGNKKLLTISFILLLVLLLSYELRPFFYVYKLAVLVYILISLCCCFTTKEKKFFKILFKDVKRKNKKTLFYDSHYDSILEANRKLSNDTYKIDLINENKLNDDLERSYLQSKIRFNGYCDIDDKTVSFKWTYVDTMILILSIILFILCIIFR